MAERIGRYKVQEIGDARAHDLVIRSLDVGAAVVTQIPRILGEWRTPKHEEFKPRTVWSLFNAFTEVSKGSGLENMTRRTINLHGLMDQACGYAPEAAETKLIGDAQDTEAVAERPEIPAAEAMYLATRFS